MGKCAAMRHVALLGAAGLISVGCHAEPAVQARTSVRIAGTSFVGSLAREYSKALPNVTITTVPAGSFVDAAELVQRGEADLGVVFADAAYSAYTAETAMMPAPAPSTVPRQIRAISTLHVAPFVLLARANAGIASIRDVRGHVVRVTGPGPTDPRFGRGWTIPAGLFGDLPKAPMTLTGVSQMVLMAFGVDPAEVRSRANLSQTEALEGLKAGTLDAWFTSDADVLAHLPPTGIRLIPIEGSAVDRVRREYSFIRPVTVPAGTYAGQ